MHQSRHSMCGKNSDLMTFNEIRLVQSIYGYEVVTKHRSQIMLFHCFHYKQRLDLALTELEAVILEIT